MSTHNTWSTGTRLLLVLGGGLLLVLAWMGGRMSAGGAGPMGMMSGGMHGESMGNGQHVQGGDGSMMRGARVDSGDAFDGEAGLRRCRSMMGTMAGMHRSMQSMMGGADGGAEGASEASRGRSRGRMGRGMMGGKMGGMHGDGDRRTRMRSMHEQMGAMRGMDPEQMRSLCRTMQETMRAAMDKGEAVPENEGAGEADFEGLSLTDETKRWLRGARGFDAVEDRTGQDEVVIEVGAGDGLQYGPAAVRVDPGTAVRWRWTGRGGLHDVAFANADVRTSLRGEEGAEFSHTFDAPGEYRYECTPHAGVGMRGIVIVAEN